MKARFLCQHRMYDASTGRWLNRDPIGLAGGMSGAFENCWSDSSFRLIVALKSSWCEPG